MRKPRRVIEPGEKRAPCGPVQAEVFQQLLERKGVTDWDVLLFGDGSGSTWDRGAGWSCLMLERRARTLSLWHGGCNFGTVNFAEVMAYLAPLQYLLSRESDRRKEEVLGGAALKVHVFTDSQYTQTTGNARRDAPGPLPAKNGLLWAGYDAMARHGLRVHWHWLSRDVRKGGSTLNVIAHHAATLSRRLVEDYNMKGEVEREMGSLLTDLTRFGP